MGNSESRLVTFTVSDGVGFLALNSPPRNEMTVRLFEQLADLVSGEMRTPDIKGVVVHGKGRHFSSGADVDELKSHLAGMSATDGAQFLDRHTDTFLAIERLAMPVVAAISGCCLGAGVELALACHFRIAADNAFLSLPETSFGIMPGCGGTVRLAGLVGPARAAELVLSGRALFAEEARSVGLVDLVVGKKELLAAARQAVLRLDGGAQSGPPPGAPSLTQRTTQS